MLFGYRQFLEYQDAAGRPAKVSIKGSPFIIGSDDGANLSVAHPDVSPRHAAIRKVGDAWEIEVVGHTPVVVDNVRVEKSSALRSGEAVDIAGVFGFVFRDLDEEAEAANSARLAGKPPATSNTTDPATRTRILAVLLFSIVSSILIGVVAVVRTPDTGVDMTSVSLSSIKVAVDSIGDCIKNAADAGRASGAWASASYDSYWRLVVDVAGGASLADNASSKQALDGLKSGVDRWLKDGMLLEGRSQSSKAVEAYDKVVKAVPDASCPAHQLAASRLNALK